MAPLYFYAGAKAMEVLKSGDFSPNMITQFLGASGGPKWFVLAGLDKALFGEYFKHYSACMNIVGSSAGAFRAACFAQSNPHKAIDRLSEHYSSTVYSTKPCAYEISQKARELLRYVLPEQGIIELLNNDCFNVHFIAAKCKKFMESEGRKRQTLGLLSSAILNTLDRKNLSYFYDRIVFSSKEDELKIVDPYGLPTQYIKMGYNTVHDALLASGSIPMVLEGVQDIVGAPAGVYRDGGIIDYHFDLDFKPQYGITLYPHFSMPPKPGWFDKHLSSRLPHKDSYENVLMIVPSEAFIQSLPHKRIPDRKDFEKIEDKPRIKYWQSVIKESERLGDYFLDIALNQKFSDVVKPLPFKCLN